MLFRSLRRYAADFLGIQETRILLERMESTYGELIKEVMRTVPLQRIAEVYRLLIAEGVSIRNQRALLESMVEWGARETDSPRLAEQLRTALARQISHQYADRNRVISAFVLAPALEEQLRNGLRRQDNARDSFPEHTNRALLVQLRSACESLPEDDMTVVLVHPEVRRALRRLVMRGELDVAVLSFRDLAGEYNLQAVGTITLNEITNRRAVSGVPTTPMATAS